MQRRAIILALGAATSPMVAHAQQADKLRSSLRVGLAGYLTNFSSAQNAFLQRLAELGFVEGRNLSFNSELTFLPNLDAAYADMVKDGVDILLALGPESALKSARRAAGGRVPVVFIAMDYDPLRSGYVASLARPGGNLTGLFVRQPELGVKRLEFTRDALPKARRVALWWDAGVARDQFEVSSAAAASFHFDLQSVEVGSTSYDFVDAMKRTTKLGAEAIILASSTMYFYSTASFAQLALEQRLPLIAFAREFVESGALLSYGVNVDDVWRQAASYVARIAGGIRPSELPVEQPAKFELVVNLRTASSLGLILTPTLLARADELIE
jgi:putative tryptophan/tyrosine transport system substrate-binding protein